MDRAQRASKWEDGRRQGLLGAAVLPIVGFVFFFLEARSWDSWRWALARIAIRLRLSAQSTSLMGRSERNLVDLAGRPITT